MLLWKRGCRCLALIISLIIIFPFIYAEEISVKYPAEVQYNKEFNFSVDLIDFQEKAYAIKIDILNNKKRVAKIYNPDKNSFVSTYFYLENAFEEGENKNEFIMKVDGLFQGDADIEIKIRDEGGIVESFKGYKIQLSGDKTPLDIEIEETKDNEKEQGVYIKKEDEKEDEDDMQEDEETENLKDIEEQVIEKKELIEENVYGSEIIMLGSPQDIKKENTNEKGEIIFESKNEKTKEYAIYGFTLFLILSAILALLTRKSDDRAKN